MVRSPALTYTAVDVISSPAPTPSITPSARPHSDILPHQMWQHTMERHHTVTTIFRGSRPSLSTLTAYTPHSTSPPRSPLPLP